MHKLLTLAILVILLSCRTEKKTQIDPRPKSQIHFIKKIVDVGDKASSGINEIRKNELVDSARNEISKYTIDSLGMKFAEWEAKIIKINDEPYGLNFVDVEFMIVKDLFSIDEQYPEFHSIILKTSINKNRKDLISIIKTMRENDEVKISGEFEYKKGILEHQNYSATGIDDLENPKINFNLKSISK